jgi:hypothetical protein
LADNTFISNFISNNSNKQKRYRFKDYTGVGLIDDTNAEILAVEEPNIEFNNTRETVKELFNSNPKLANQVYSTLGFELIDESKITTTDEFGKPCKFGDNNLKAEDGLTNTIKGSNLKIVKDFKGQPKHSQGGVDISISDAGVSMRRGGKDIKAAHGLLIASNGLVTSSLDIKPEKEVKKEVKDKIKIEPKIEPKKEPEIDFPEEGIEEPVYQTRGKNKGKIIGTRHVSKEELIKRHKKNQ